MVAHVILVHPVLVRIQVGLRTTLQPFGCSVLFFSDTSLIRRGRASKRAGAKAPALLLARPRPRIAPPETESYFPEFFSKASRTKSRINAAVPSSPSNDESMHNWYESVCPQRLLVK